MPRPVGGQGDTLGQSFDVEPVLACLDVHFLFFVRQKIEQQCAETALPEVFRHRDVSRAETAAPAAMREDDEANGVVGHFKVCLNTLMIDEDDDGLSDCIRHGDSPYDLCLMQPSCARLRIDQG